MEGRKTRLTKRILSESLIELMLSKPVDQITVSELCRQADINRTTFYRYYTTPQDILSDIQSHLSEQYQSVLHNKNSHVERLTAILQEVRKNQERASALNHEVNRSIYENIPYQNPPKGSPPDPFYVLLAGDVPPRLRAYARYMTSSAMTLWLQNGCDIDDETFAQMLLDVCTVCKNLCL